MAASTIYRCLYIMEVHSGSPELLLCLNAATGELQWHICKEGLNLAVDQRTGNVILMCAREIVEYDHNGQVIRTIPLPEDGMDELWQAVPVRDNQFVISQVGYGFSFYTKDDTDVGHLILLSAVHVQNSCSCYVVFISLITMWSK